MLGYQGLVKLFKAAKAHPKTTVATIYGGALGTALVHDWLVDPDELPDDMMPGEVMVQFPLDYSSAGDFWTEMSFFTWKRSQQGTILEEVNTQSSSIKTNFLGILRLPMPLQLQTAYSGKFSEADSMDVDRDGRKGGALSRGVGLARGLMVEMKEAGNALVNLNNTASMSNASINNNNMGMKYEGGTLRGHSFSWRLSAKNEEEQHEIKKVIAMLKGMSLPANNWGGKEDYEEFMKSIDALSDEKKDALTLAMPGKKPGGLPLAGGRLTIPPTVAVRFLDGEETNPHLFKIKDSFITNVEVNYTSQGSWQAHEDGSPMEVQISITLKEVKMITRKDVLAGY